MSGSAAHTCRALVHALPGHVADQARRTVSGSGYAAAWGDPAIELRCGVRRPARLDRFATCQVVNGVGWWIPESQMSDRATDLTMTTVGRRVFVSVRLPSDYFPPATAMADLAPAVRRADPMVRRCV